MLIAEELRDCREPRFPSSQARVFEPITLPRFIDFPPAVDAATAPPAVRAVLERDAAQHAREVAAADGGSASAEAAAEAGGYVPAAAKPRPQPPRAVHAAKGGGTPTSTTTFSRATAELPPNGTASPGRPLARGGSAQAAGEGSGEAPLLRGAETP